MAKVLCVENDTTLLDDNIAYLEEDGHEVLYAEDGVQGLEQLDQNDGIEIIFTKFDMPDMDGSELASMIRTDPRHSRYAHIPIIGISHFPRDQREYITECLIEPYDPEELLRCIGQYCRK